MISSILMLQKLKIATKETNGVNQERSIHSICFCSSLSFTHCER
ncbi:hypothetical protein [Gemella cuniculi]|nr:hypothetical protein [Gemella cuniculi]